MTFTSDITTGIARVLADNGLALYNPTGLYPTNPTLPVITIKALPPNPDSVIAITAYNTVTTPDGTATTSVQVRLRAGTYPTDVDDLTDAVVARLHGLSDQAFGDTHAVLLTVTSQAPLPADANGRWEATVNVAVLHGRPALASAFHGGRCAGDVKSAPELG